MNPVPKKKRVKNPELIAEMQNRIKKCEYCGQSPTFFPLDVHHIRSRGVGGDDSEKNLIVLCRYPCHDRAGKREIPASYLQYIVERRTWPN